MKLDVSMLTHDLKSIPDYARKVEAMGYDCLWSSETQHDPYLPLAVAATSTSRIKLGTNIATVFSRSPMITAHTAWDLQKASGGALRAGPGHAGEGAQRAALLGEVRVARAQDGARRSGAIRTIWDCWQNGTSSTSRGSSTPSTS